MICKKKIKIYTIILGFLIVSCENQEKSEPQENFLKSLNEWQEFKLIQTDDRYGEWGGNTFILRIYKNADSDSILADYKELEGSPDPPPTPDPDSINKPWYNYKPVVMEKKGIKLSAREKELIQKSILELTINKLENKNRISHSGISNAVIFQDSSLIIKDYPSINWSNFQKLKKSVLEK
ncbi:MULTISPECIES: hypothetical protein [unclassified Leeuwenhoekiella]|uniref:hypothetical protein n=1 Tax=unclassified Leeuwenhoekiella TaxID=2615029 RepID=UPI000C6AA2A5|nr:MULTISPECIES: hypothetical protein [unclassified Leeuwenhoekiella]MAW94146.1 hypothetical protein [Leeuwenhoekiella sp.]MBA82443.1 hypothetical protein [Leeuwenhoekiella sp.]|tara:strand:- start:52960 stop:53499 length:540 start_codon:yes stop_codon:yes gene_type:complete